MLKPHSIRTYRQKTRQLLSVSLFALLSVTAHAAEPAASYCAAVRGNGQSMPSHWGALATAMETYGAPSGMAGGSSGSITTFLWESADLNPLLATENFQRGREQALMFKSLEGVTDYMYEKPRWKALASWVTQAMNPSLQALQMANLSQSLQMAPEALQALSDLRDSKLFFGPAIQSIFKLVMDPTLQTNPLKAERLIKELGELKETLAVFGKFDAQSDLHMFVRDGIVDFTALARLMSALADYLSLRGASPEAVASYQRFLQSCTSPAIGHTWPQIVQANPSCRDLLNASLDQYFESPSRPYSMDSANTRMNDRIGARRVLVSTSVVGGDSAQKFRKIRQAYLNSLASDFNADFQVADQDLHFAYWGRTADLMRAMQGLKAGPFADLDKSKRFLALPPSTWRQALSLSPAEPGLSSAVELSTVHLRSDLISFGGWSDLYPIPVLKAAGCEHVVYIQRRGGDTLFGIGTVKRLLGFAKPEWDLLTDTPAGNTLNNNGLQGDNASTWGRLYNLRNPRSSYAASVSASDAVVCTDWDKYDVTTQFSELISTSYQSPIFESTAMPHSPDTNAQFITREQNQVDPATGYAPYAGCIPLQ